MGEGTREARPRPTRVVVVDPLPLARFGLAALLATERNMRVVAEAACADDAIAALSRLKGSHAGTVVVVSLGLTGLHDSYWLIQVVRRRFPSIRVLVTGTSARSSDVSRSLFEGADGFVDKTLECAAFPRSIRRICHGDLVLETISGIDASDILHDLERQRHVANMLTEREREILLLAADGLTARQIGSTLGLSDRTITTHFGRIYSKLGVNSRLGAIREATRCGAITSSAVV